MTAIDSRGRQAFPNRAHLPFGGLFILLLGDFGQLPPVADNSLYSNKCNNGRDGKLAYLQIICAIVLTDNMRQLGPQQESFRNSLLRLRDGLVSEENHQLFMTRLEDNVSNDEKKTFSNATLITPLNSVVNDYNAERLLSLSSPIVTIKGVHTGINAKNAASESAKGLEAITRLSIGSEVMLISRNLAVPFRLFNGACGVVKYIYYLPGIEPPALPTAIFVYFDGYTGPSFFVNEPKVVPLVPIKQEWETLHGTCSRLQLPLTLAWALSIYKSQGQTIPKYKLDIGIKEIGTGSTFVGLSRTNTLDGILLTPTNQRSNNYSRWSGIGNSAMLQLRKLEDARLLSLEANVVRLLATR